MLSAFFEVPSYFHNLRAELCDPGTFHGIGILGKIDSRDLRFIWRAANAMAAP